jgi:WD40 repeat protein
MPDGRAFTLCAAPNAHSPLTLWDLETGHPKEHKLNGVPAHVAWIDDQRYVVATIDEKMAIREFDGGKVTGKLQSWADYKGGGICMVASGLAGKLVAVLFFDGTLMIWDISGSKIKALGRHARIAPRALVMDPDSSWVVTPGTNEVLTWKEGQPARAILGAGPPAVRRAEPFEDVGLAVFVRPTVVAVGGQSVNLWDLETSRHVGRWDKPVTTMVSALGRLLVGDTEGNIWEVDVV